MKGTSVGGQSISFQCLVVEKAGSVSRFAGGTAVCGCNKQRLRMRVQAEELLPLPATAGVSEP